LESLPSDLDVFRIDFKPNELADLALLGGQSGMPNSQEGVQDH